MSKDNMCAYLEDQHISSNRGKRSVPDDHFQHELYGGNWSAFFPKKVKVFDHSGDNGRKSMF